jgi:hypothetical protein
MICIDFLPKHYSTDFPVYTFYVVSKKYFWQSWVHVFNSCHMLSNELHSSAVACIIYASIMHINLTQSIKYSHALYIIVYSTSHAHANCYAQWEAKLPLAWVWFWNSAKPEDLSLSHWSVKYMFYVWKWN